VAWYKTEYITSAVYLSEQVSPSRTASVENDEHEKDLELSSFVMKAKLRIKNRFYRFF
jgi:hypothetical protein